MWWPLIIIILCQSIQLTFSTCPNSCSGNGLCGKDALCKCFDGWGELDCSLKQCSTGRSWADKASASQTAHAPVQCSNRGKCNPDNGVCECDEGFTGLGCERTLCPAQCSGHGTCHSIYSLGKFYKKSTAAAVEYANWDAGKMYGCVCDFGYFGIHCGWKYCPKSDDLLTESQVDYQLRIAIASTALLGGTARLEFQGSSTYFNANGDSETDSSCKTFMEHLGGINSATCTKAITDSTSKSVTYTVTITSWPFPVPYQNNVYSHNGNPPISDFVCDTTDITSSASISCSVTLLSTASSHKEYETCAGRGKCTWNTGTCNCDAKFAGLGCEILATSVAAVVCSEADMSVSSTCSTFSSTVMNIQTTKISAVDFHYLTAKANSEDLFKIRGDGLVHILQGGLSVVAGGHTVMQGGLKIPLGGSTVNGGGMYIDESGAILKQSDGSAATFTVHASHSSFTNDALAIKVTRTSNTAYNMLHLVAGSTTMFTVLGNGKATVHQTGLNVITGGISIAGGGLHVYQGNTIHTTGLQVVAGGATITETGLQVIDGGSRITTTAQTTSALTVHANHASYTGSALYVRAKRLGVTAYHLINALSNNVQKFYLTGDGILSLSNGNEVLTGGMTIAAGGLDIKGGATVYTGGLNIPLAGATVTDGGLVVDADGMVTKNSANSDHTFTTLQTATSTNTGVRVESTRASNTAFRFIKGETSSSTERFSIYGNGDFVTLADTISTSGSSGSIILSGGLGIAKQLYTGGILSIEDNTQATSYQSGALTSLGGLGVAKDLYVGGIVVVHSGSSTQPHSFTGETRLRTYSDTPSTATVFNLQRSRGTAGSRTALHNGDTLGEVEFKGYVSDGSGGNVYLAGAKIHTTVENAGTPVSGNQMGSKLLFSTVSSGANSLTNRVQIDMAQQIKILTTTDATTAATGSLYTQGGMFVAKSLYTGGKLYSILSDTATTASKDVVVIGQSVTTASSSAVGIGTAIQFGAESSTGSMLESGSIDFKLTSIADGGENSNVDIRTITGGSVTDAFSVNGVATTVHPTTASTTSATGSLRSLGGLGVGKAIYSAGQLVSKLADTSSGNTEVMHIRHTSSGTVANGFGLGINFQIEDAGGISEAGSLEYSYTDATNKHSQADIKVVTSGNSKASALTIFGNTGIAVTPTTPSTSPNTGAFKTAGGAGIAKSIYNGGQLVATIDDNANNVVTDVLVLQHSTTGTVANNIGVGIVYGVESLGGLATVASFDVKLSDKTHANANAQCDITTISGGATRASAIITVSGPGQHGTQYQLTISGSTASYTVANGGNAHDTDAATTAGNIKTALDNANIAGFAFAINGAAITITGATSGAQFSYNGNANLVALSNLANTNVVTTTNGVGALAGASSSLTVTPTLSTINVIMSCTGSLSVNRHATIGNAASDTTSWQGTVQGGSPLLFEGATDNSVYTTLAIETLTADRTVKLPDASGTVITTGNRAQIVRMGTLSGLTVSGSLTTSQNNILGDAVDDIITIGAYIQHVSGASIVFQGASSTYKTTLAIDAPSTTRIQQLPDATGTIVSEGNLADITVTGTLSTLTVSGTTTLQAATIVGDAEADVIKLEGTIQGASAITFEGATANDFETTLSIVQPTQDGTITLPGATGTIITTGNLDHITSTGTLTSLNAQIVNLNGNVALSNSGGSAALTVTAKVQNFDSRALVFEGTTTSNTVTKLAITEQSTSSKVIKLPSATGTVISTGNLANIVSVGTLDSLIVSGTVSFQADTAIGSDGSDTIIFNGKFIGNDPMIFEGNTQNSYASTLRIETTPDGVDQDANVKFPDAGGTIVTTGNMASTITTVGTLTALTVSGTSSLNGNVEIGDSNSADFLKFNGIVQGTSPLSFEGSNTGDTYQTILALDGPTSSHKTVTLPAATGTVITTLNQNQVTVMGTLGALTITTTGTHNGNTNIGNLEADTLTVNALVVGQKPLIFEGSTNDNHATEIEILAASGTDKTITVPNDCGGTIITTGNLDQITDLPSMAAIDIAANGVSSLNGGTTLFNGLTEFEGTFQGATPIVLEGKLEFSDLKQTNIAVNGPTSDRTITFPNVDGTIITVGNAPDIITTGTRDTVTVTGATAFGGTTTFGNAVTDTITFGGTLPTSIQVEGSTSGTAVQTLSIEKVDANAKTLSLPDSGGNLVTTGNFGDITTTGTLNSLTVSNTFTTARLDISDSTVTQQTDATTGVAITKSVGRITTVSLTLAGNTCEFFFVTPDAGFGWTQTSIIMVNIVAYGGSNGTPHAYVASRTNSNFYLAICNGHNSNALDGTVTIGYTFM
jgi:hypothetical protein